MLSHSMGNSYDNSEEHSAFILSVNQSKQSTPIPGLLYPRDEGTIITWNISNYPQIYNV